MNRRRFLSFAAEQRATAPAPIISVLAGLEPYVPSLDNPWNERTAAHLLRRTGFGARREKVEAVLAVDPLLAVNAIVDAAVKDPLPDVPAWHDTYPPPRGSSADERAAFSADNRTWFAEYRAEWLTRMLYGGLRENLALFWSNHFVTEAPAYTLAAYASRYLTLMRVHALGNFKKFVYDVGLTPAMLRYLNGHDNNKNNPNENYARELLELFTTGIGFYTEEDIAELSRALTGWRVDYYSHSVSLVDSRHDFGEKTIFNQTGNWGYDDAIDLIFQERAAETATYICRKLYRHFVYDTPDETIVAQLSQVFLANDFHLEPVIRTLLSSAHFFQQDFIGARVKSPAEAMIGFLAEINHNVAPDQLYRRVYRYMNELGQIIFSPPDVSGWPGHHFWVSSTTLSLRWYYAQFLLNGTSGFDTYDPIPYASTIPNHQDAYELAFTLANRLLAVPVSEDQKTVLGEVLLNGAPYYEWDLFATGSAFNLRNFLLHLCRLPEFQLT